MTEKQSIEPSQHQINDTVSEQAVELEFIQLNSSFNELYATVNRFSPSLYNESTILKLDSQRILKSFKDNIRRLQVFRQLKERQQPLYSWENEGGSIKHD